MQDRIYSPIFTRKNKLSFTFACRVMQGIHFLVAYLKIRHKMSPQKNVLYLPLSSCIVAYHEEQKCIRTTAQDQCKIAFWHRIQHRIWLSQLQRLEHTMDSSYKKGLCGRVWLYIQGCHCTQHKTPQCQEQAYTVILN